MAIVMENADRPFRFVLSIFMSRMVKVVEILKEIRFCKLEFKEIHV